MGLVLAGAGFRVGVQRSGVGCGTVRVWGYGDEGGV